MIGRQHSKPDDKFHLMSCDERFESALTSWRESRYRTPTPPERHFIERIHDAEIGVALVEGWPMPAGVVEVHQEVWARHQRVTLF